MGTPKEAQRTPKKLTSDPRAECRAPDRRDTSRWALVGEGERVRILYATDGSAAALAGAQFLSAMSLGSEDEVTILTVCAGDEGADKAALAAAREQLGDAAPLRTAVRRGHAVDEILAAATETEAALIVVGWKGHSAIARFFLGSVAEHVARHASCPVLVARPLRGELDQVLVGLDGSEAATQASEWLLRLPLPRSCRFRLATVLPQGEVAAGVPDDRLPGLAARLRGNQERERASAERTLVELATFYQVTGRHVERQVYGGDPALRLLELIEAHQMDLAVLGAQGLSAIERFIMGSVSEKVLRYAPCSVLIVRQP